MANANGTMKLNQAIAMVSGKKTRSQKQLTELHRGWQVGLIEGGTRTYTPKDEQGQQLPKEENPVQLRVNEVFSGAKEILTDYWDAVCTQETGNQGATASLHLPGLDVNDIPVTVLLFLEKQLNDLHTLVQGVPTLKTEYRWTFDEATDCYVSEPVEQVRTKKVQKPIVLYDATDKHPAQTQLITEDEVIGSYHTTLMSGAIPLKEKRTILTRITELQEKVKLAREEANGATVETARIGEGILDYVFGTSAD